MEEVHPVSEAHLIQVRLMRAIIRLCKVVTGQSHLEGENQIVGNSIIVGIKIFNIVVGLGLVGGLFHGFVLWLPVGQGRCLLHMLKRLGVGWGLRRRQ